MASGLTQSVDPDDPAISTASPTSRKIQHRDNRIEKVLFRRSSYEANRVNANVFPTGVPGIMPVSYEHNQLADWVVDLTGDIKTQVEAKEWKDLDGNLFNLVGGTGHSIALPDGLKRDISVDFVNDQGKAEVIIPDGYVMRKGTSFPFLILEVVHSETFRAAHKMRKKVIEHSKGECTLLVQIDLKPVNPEADPKDYIYAVAMRVWDLPWHVKTETEYAVGTREIFTMKRMENKNEATLPNDQKFVINRRHVMGEKGHHWPDITEERKRATIAAENDKISMNLATLCDRARSVLSVINNESSVSPPGPGTGMTQVAAARSEMATANANSQSSEEREPTPDSASGSDDLMKDPDYKPGSKGGA